MLTGNIRRGEMRKEKCGKRCEKEQSMCIWFEMVELILGWRRADFLAQGLETVGNRDYEFLDSRAILFLDEIA